MSEKTRYIVLVIVGVAIIGTIGYLESQKAGPDGGSFDASLGTIAGTNLPTSEEKAGIYERAKEVSTPDGFINTDPITIEELIGKKVILVDFWTYSCINCQRTLPYLNAWHDKYADDGLVILGVHTPEFEFEKKYDNVQAAVDKFKVNYPVILDNDFSTWYSYKNRYWPRKYLIDIDGYIVYDHIGEGSYDETEREIQKLLSERSARLAEATNFTSDIVNPDGVETTQARSPEIYFGAARNELLGNGKQFTEGEQVFSRPTRVEPNMLYFSGTWDVDKEFSVNRKSNDSIIFTYNAKKVHMVASGSNGPVAAEVYIDGNLVSGLRGADVGENGVVVFDEEGLYNLIDDASGPATHTIEIRPLMPGLQAYTFTFG